MVSSEKEEIISALSAKIYEALIEDVIMDTVLQSHHELLRSRAVCSTCNTRCGSVHVPGPPFSNMHISQSAPGSPSAVDGKVSSGGSGTGTNTPTSRSEGNIYLTCTVCQRQIASNRYAPHLSSCMGLSNGTRRSGARGAAKSKNSLDTGRSPSVDSEAGNLSDDSGTTKSKGKNKNKRSDDADFNLKRKRAPTPQISPNKKQKKQKVAATPLTRVKSDPDGLSLNSFPSSVKAPSRLREDSTASFAERSSSSDSRDSSPDLASAPTPSSTAAVSTTRSPTLPTRGRPPGSKNAKKTPAHAPSYVPTRPSPPRPPPPTYQDYSLDAEGDETGSSTDTDSS